MEVGLNRAHFLLFLFLLIHLVPGSTNSFRGEELEYGGGRHHEPERAQSRKGLFMLHSPKQIIKTEGGKFTVFRGVRRRETNSALHIGFLNMEPNTLLVPQYMDASLILFIRRGEAKVGWIHKNELVERTLKSGDVYRIPAGSAFYMVNKANGQRLQIICSIDTSESLGGDLFETFFVAGGSYPTSVLAGFDVKTLTTAFNVSVEELRPIMERQNSGPIVYMTKEDTPSRWSNLMKLQHKLRRTQIALDEEDDDIGNKGGMEQNERTEEWSWRNLLDSLLGKDEEEQPVAAAAANTIRSPDSYNLFDRSPDFENRYGWSLAIDGHHYSPLKGSGIGVYYVNLSAGSMMAPHLNPTATEYGVVLRGCGSVQVVFPNGTSGMNTEVEEGDVFWVPRYFPFCQIASRSGPLEFFGFTTSARRNLPQFLAGKSSLLRTLGGAEMAAAFGVAEQRYRKITGAQQESVIIPSWPEPAGDDDDGRRGTKKAVSKEEEVGIVEAVAGF